jgi:DNA-binding transcriptional regulator PaaX
MNGLKIAESFAKLQGVEIKARELVEEWILITYDIPVTEEGNEARLKFLKQAPRIGAMMHSRSVYLMPNTQQAQLASVELSKINGAEVYLWTAKVEGEQAVQITDFYDTKIQEQIDTINRRIAQEDALIADEKFGMADRMHRKTANLFSQSCFTVAQRGATAKIIEKLTKIENKLTGMK